MAKQTFSVDVPTNADDLITLAKAIIAKDAALGASSPFKCDVEHGLRDCPVTAITNTTAFMTSMNLFRICFDLPCQIPTFYARLQNI